MICSPKHATTYLLYSVWVGIACRTIEVVHRPCVCLVCIVFVVDFNYLPKTSLLAPKSVHTAPLTVATNPPNVMMLTPHYR
mmetsp:Transcript_80058/g.141288  ORF Transcript_80058/g.141288 Transcript_80058/m.141288 type:complete len:81 (+) Transcript_80058:307-549(+)